MKGKWRDAVHYRNRAMLLRAIADEIEGDDQKRALCRVAEYCEKVADALERETKAATA